MDLSVCLWSKLSWLGQWVNSGSLVPSDELCGGLTFFADWLGLLFLVSCIPVYVESNLSNPQKPKWTDCMKMKRILIATVI